MSCLGSVYAAMSARQLCTFVRAVCIVFCFQVRYEYVKFAEQTIPGHNYPPRGQFADWRG